MNTAKIPEQIEKELEKLAVVKKAIAEAFPVVKVNDERHCCGRYIKNEEDRAHHNGIFHRYPK